MISVLSTNITSPLGFTTEQNYQAVLTGTSALKRYEGMWGLPEPFAASLFSEEQKAALALDGFTRFEALAIHSVREALSQTQLDVASPRVVLIISTTKGNVEVLGDTTQEGRYFPSKAAQTIADALGISTKPIVVCNACVSGLSTQLLANNLLSAGLYDYAIVVGAEVQSKFIVSGFQSLKAVSDEPCRPFDIERIGLNLGEAAATIIFARTSNKENWCLVDGATCNDAFHNISPSPKADGCTKAIEAVMKDWDKSQLATVCVHGTATLYNDQMESVAIERTGLSEIPLSALKGYYGHTMGAAGVLETILTMRATDDGIVLGSKGFTEVGVSGKVSINNEIQQTNKSSFLKLLSGFGGSNVAALFSKTTDNRLQTTDLILHKTHTIKLSSTGGKTLTDIYKQQIGNYPKFYKMDILTRLAFVASELLIKEMGETQEEPAIILFNHSSSLVADRQYLKTICDADNFFPSPSVFVYTLPNITTGEIAIRNHFQGETSFYILPEKDEALMQQIHEATLNATNAKSAISGWIDAESDTKFECEISNYIIQN